MISKNKSGEIEIQIPISGIEDLQRYKEGILAVLGKIELKDCNLSLKEHIKTIYEVLGHLSAEAESQDQHNFLPSTVK